MNPFKYIQCYSYTLHGRRSHKQSSGAAARAPRKAPSSSSFCNPPSRCPEIPNSGVAPAYPACSLVISLQSLAGSSLNTHSALGRPSSWFNYCLARVCASSPTRSGIRRSVYRVLEKFMAREKESILNLSAEGSSRRVFSSDLREMGEANIQGCTDAEESIKRNLINKRSVKAWILKDRWKYIRTCSLWSRLSERSTCL